MRSKILIWAYKLFPFSLKGDAITSHADYLCDVSCIINFYGRIDLLEGILNSIQEQNLPRNLFEVILIEDRGGTEQGKAIAVHFSDTLNIRYFPLQEHYGLMGYSRNYGLSKANGKYILFLDDDTVILQKDFLANVIHEFVATNADGLIPYGSASYYLLKGRYGYHEPYFATNRCMAYKREVLRDLGGFVSHIIGQEDVEFVMRYLMSGRTFRRTPGLAYYHPPLLMPNLRKPKAVGNSFYQLKRRYPFAIWLLVILNGARHAPLVVLPIRKYREMGRFGLGFFIGVVVSPFKKNGFRYT